jgi:AmiR/NasT family two-component response regulator
VAIRAERKRYANTVLELRELVAQLQDALANRAVIEQAKGMIMAQSRCTSDQAFDVLRRASQRTNRKVRDIATELVSRSQEVTSKAP